MSFTLASIVTVFSFCFLVYQHVDRNFRFRGTLHVLPGRNILLLETNTASPAEPRVVGLKGEKITSKWFFGSDGDRANRISTLHIHSHRSTHVSLP